MAPYRGMVGHERAEDVRQPVEGTSRQRHDALLRASEVRNLICCGLQRPKDPLDVRPECHANPVQADATSLTAKLRNAHLAFKPLDRLAKGRLGDIGFTGSPDHVPRAAPRPAHMRAGAVPWTVTPPLVITWSGGKSYIFVA